MTDELTGFLSLGSQQVALFATHLLFCRCTRGHLQQTKGNNALSGCAELVMDGCVWFDLPAGFRAQGTAVVPLLCDDGMLPKTWLIAGCPWLLCCPSMGAMHTTLCTSPVQPYIVVGTGLCSAMQLYHCRVTADTAW